MEGREVRADGQGGFHHRQQLTGAALLDGNHAQEPEVREAVVLLGCRFEHPVGAGGHVLEAPVEQRQQDDASPCRAEDRQVAGGLAELHDLCEVGLELGSPAERQQRVPAQQVQRGGDVEAGGELGPPRVLGLGSDGQGLVAQAEPVRRAGKTQGGRDQPEANRGGDLGRARLDVGKQLVRRLDVVGEPGVALDRATPGA